MAGRSLLKKWIGEYNAVVVVTVATAEAENICLKNGLLFHELLSSFGHLDGLNTTVRTGNGSFTMTDAHIRFERSTEVKVKSADLVEKLMKETFEDFEMSRMPQSVGELKTTPPTSWTLKTEQIVSRLQSFHECEMTSHPYLILTVVATSDVDHILCMQELASAHHTPACLSNGQYDPTTVQRLFVLLHDAHDDSRNPYMLLQQLQARFNAASTKLLTINSFPENTPNLQQPDMWSRFMAPRFYPQNIPENPNANPANLAINPINGQPVLGSRLSMEDFMSLRNFCVDIYNQYIVPNIERRLIFLTKQVNDNKKGMKNVLKSFWRKSREETDNGRGQVKYRYDKIESQILLLADTSFMIKDFETALAMYKLVKDDFKADKSLLHLAHTHLMMAACHVITEPGKIKELHPDLETLGQLLISNGELPHVNAYYAMLAAEMYVAHTANRSPLDAASILLVAVKNMQQCQLLSSMMIEKAASYFLQASQNRKYVFYTVITANKLLRCGMRPARHAAVCYAAAMMLVEQGHWGDLKGKLCRALGEDRKFQGKEGARRSLLLMMRLLSAAMCEGSDVGHTDSLVDAVNVFREITSGGAWGHIEVVKNWNEIPTRDMLLDALPINEIEAPAGKGECYCEVADLPVPVLDVPSAALIHSTSGVEAYSCASEISPAEIALAEEMYAYLELERQWMEEHARRVASQAASGAADDQLEDTLSDKWAQLDAELLRYRDTNNARNLGDDWVARVPLGEKVKLRVKLSNKLPLEVQLSDVRLLVEPAAHFETKGVSLSLAQDVTKEVILVTQPLQLGRYRLDTARWNLSDNLCVKQSLTKQGPLLQRTRQQRANGERGPDTTLCFEVVPSHPLLKIEFEGISPEILQGQLLKSTLVLRNEGAATACDIFIKLSQPLFVFYLSQVIDGDGSTKCTSPSNSTGLIGMYGGSSTVLRLAEGTSIAPGQALRFEAWLMVSKTGMQKVSLLASYKALREDGTRQPFGPGTKCRTSFVSIKTKVLPSLGIALRLVPKPSSADHFTMVTEIVNYLRNVDLEGAAEDFGRDRFSSVGQLDLPTLSGADDHIEVEDNAIKVMGMWLLGAGVPFKYKPSPRMLANSATGEHHARSHSAAGGPDLLACPSERIARCFPIKLASSSAAPSSAHAPGKCSWLLPMPTVDAKDSHHHLVRVVEQFLCIANSTARFEKEIESSRLLVQAAELEAETMGPRSIAQVRREKLEQLAKAGGSADLASAAASTRPNKVPESAQDIANLAAGRNGVVVAAVWACRWEGKLRWGMHKISSLNFVGDGVSAVGGQMARTSNKAGDAAAALISKSLGVGTSAHSNRPAADFLLVGLSHAPTVSICADKNGAVDVPVTLQLRSLSSEPLSVSITAIDYASSHDAKQSPAGPHYIYNDAPDVTIEKVANLGMRWNGKTQYIGIVVPPNGQQDISVNALITQAGSYDLNRFKVSVRYSHGSNPQLVQKQIIGQSMLMVSSM